MRPQWRISDHRHQLVFLCQPLEQEGGIHRRAPQSQNVCLRHISMYMVLVQSSSFVLSGPEAQHSVNQPSDSRSPLNEDVFTPQSCEGQVTTPDIVQLSEQIHRVLVQPVHSGSSQGYSSLGSSGSRGSRRSHQQHLSASATSSSDSNGPAMDEAAAAITLHKPVSLSYCWFGLVSCMLCRQVDSICYRLNFCENFVASKTK